MTTAQLKSSYAMAAHFGHAVGGLPYEVVVRLADDPAALAAAVDESTGYCESGYGLRGIVDLRMEHVTCTGATRVVVGAGGLLTIERFVSQWPRPRRVVAVVAEGRKPRGTITAEIQAALTHLYGIQAIRTRLG